MKSVVNMSALVLTFSMAVSSLAKAEVSDNNRWMISAPILRPGPPGSFDEVSVKDPSIVHFEGLWHLFYTSRSKTEYTTGYLEARENRTWEPDTK